MFKLYTLDTNNSAGAQQRWVDDYDFSTNDQFPSYNSPLISYV